METAKIFENGRSQAVRLPKKYRFSGDEVYIQKLGDIVIMVPKEKVWDVFLEGLNELPDDIFAGDRLNGPFQERENL